MTAAPSTASLLSQAAERFARRPALCLEDKTLTYGDASAAVDRLVHELKRVVGTAEALRGARIAVVAPNVPSLVIAMFAAWRVRAVCVPLSARLREFELTRVIQDADPAAIVSVESHGGYSFVDLFEQLAPRLPHLRGCLFVTNEGDVESELSQAGPMGGLNPLGPEVAAILYTSGTTGEPKGALMTHASAIHSARQLAGLLRLEPKDASVLVIPASHAFGLACLLAAISAASLAVLVDSTFSLEPLIKAVAAPGVTVLHGSPALFSGLVKARPEGLGSVRTGFVGGASCPPEVIEELDRRGTRVLNVFGMTEIGAAAACRLEDPPEVRYTTVGRPIPGYELRIAADGGDSAQEGELQVRGSYVTPGYYRHPERTAEAFDGDWFRTGDLGSLDHDGFLHISGRAKDVVHVAGFNVFPAEVESFLLTHPDVVRAAVVGVPRVQVGEALEAFVVARPGSTLTAAALLRFARSRIAGYKLPYRVHFLDDLPLLASGKPDRSALVDKAQRTGTSLADERQVD